MLKSPAPNAPSAADDISARWLLFKTNFLPSDATLPESNENTVGWPFKVIKPGLIVLAVRERMMLPSLTSKFPTLTLLSLLSAPNLSGADVNRVTSGVFVIIREHTSLPPTVMASFCPLRENAKRVGTSSAFSGKALRQSKLSSVRRLRHHASDVWEE